MRHHVRGNQLGRPTNQAKALYRNLVSELLNRGRIQTTLPKAKAITGLVDRVISFAKKSDISARREVIKILGSDKLTDKIFTEIGPRYVDRSSGFSRIFRLGPRLSDASEMVVLELVEGNQTPPPSPEKPAAIEPKQKAQVKSPKTKK